MVDQQDDHPGAIRYVCHAIGKRIVRSLHQSIICSLCLLLPVVCFGQQPSEINFPDKGQSHTESKQYKAGNFSPVLLVAQRSQKHAAKGDPTMAPPPVKTIEATPNASVEVDGQIDGGKRIALRWAETSTMACWPGIRNQYYNGHHVLYTTTLPPYSEMFIELHPAAQVDLSLYAYSKGTSGPLPLPPQVRSAVSCEASYLHGIRSLSVTKNPGGMEKVRLNAIRNPYRVVIGVAGAHDAVQGSFQLKVDLKSR